MWERIDGSPEEPSWWSEDIAESIDRAGAPLLAMENLQPAVTVCDGELDPNTRLMLIRTVAADDGAPDPRTRSYRRLAGSRDGGCKYLHCK